MLMFVRTTVRGCVHEISVNVVSEDEDSSKSDAATRLVYHVPFDASRLNFPIPRESGRKRHVNL